MMTACDAHTVTANDSQVAGARGIHKHPAVRSRARENYYAEALYKDPCAMLDDLREAVTTLEDTERICLLYTSDAADE